jgi:catechol 2,3-dioxygenase-like lactoylglutathione lyase family enzyme
VITGIPIVAVWVLDQEAAKEFYTAKLGCTVTNDIELDNGMRWLTVRPAGSSGQELLLIDPARSMLDADTASQVRALVAKGALSPGVMATTDCAADHARLAARGVEFIQPPARRPYGVEAVLRDDSGNWYSFTERSTGGGTLKFCPWRNRAYPANWPGTSYGHRTRIAIASWRCSG